MRNGLFAALLFLLAACGQQDDAPPAAETAEPPVDVAATLDAIYAEFDEEQLKLNPFSATFRGDPRYNGEWFPMDPLSDEYFEAELAMNRRYLEQLESFDPAPLTGQDRLSYDVFRLSLQNSIESAERGYDRFAALTPVSQFFSVPNFMVLLGSGNSAQPFNTVEDYDNWLSRSAGFAGHVDFTIRRMREGVEAGVVQPTILMEKTLPQLEAQLVETVEESAFWQPIANLPETFSDEDRSRLEAAYRRHIEDVIVPAYRELHDYIANEYMQHTRDSIGQGEVPGGEEYYAWLVRQRTTTNMTPEEIHEIGKREAGRLYAEMEKVKEEVGFEGDMNAFFDFLLNDPQFYFESAEELVAAYDELRNVINPTLDKLFATQPKSDYILKEVEPFRAQAMAAAQYFPGTPDGSRPGVFYINTYDLPARPKWMMETLSIHEASPGHHFQVSISQEVEELPAFRRFGGYTAYNEGWGLYAESLGKELGLYTDPYQYFGTLYADIWRANRLIVDTGMHALGWTRQQAIDWMQSNSPMADTDAIAEVDRYIAIPAQALAYKIGQLKIRELRTRAEEALGEAFDVREFHDQVLTVGALPLIVLEQHIDRWIAAEKAEAGTS